MAARSRRSRRWSRPTRPAGRGRLGRTWVAPAGSALAVSVLVVPRTASGPLPLDRFGWLPIAAGVAMTDTVAEVLPDGIHRLQVAQRRARQRPQGVRRAGRAAARARRRGDRRRRQPRHDRRAAAGRHRDLAGDRGRRRLHRRHRPGRLPVAPARTGGGLPRGRRRRRARAGWPGSPGARCITLGRAVRVELPDGAELEGTATALDADGRLVVRLADGRDETVAAGDVTHARMVPPGPVA